MTTSVTIGPMRVDERPWVTSSWLRSYEAHEVPSHLSREQYWRSFGHLVDALVDVGEVLVARNPADETQALAWLCKERDKPTLHYLYVKWVMRDARGSQPLGLAKTLVRHAFGGYLTPRTTFSTAAWLKWCAKRSSLRPEHDGSLIAVTRAQARRGTREEARP